MVYTSSISACVSKRCGQSNQHKEGNKQNQQSDKTTEQTSSKDDKANDKSYKRIISLMPSNTEILYELD